MIPVLPISFISEDFVFLKEVTSKIKKGSKDFKEDGRKILEDFEMFKIF